MANTFIKATQVVSQMLGVLERDVVMPSLITRMPGTNFTGAASDTVSLRVPAYGGTANSRTMRSTTQISHTELDETKVDVVLNTHIYKSVRVTDEEMTLDIVNFGEQITQPAMGAVTRGVEDLVTTALSGASPAVTVDLTASTMIDGIIDAGRALTDHRIPTGGRFLACGSRVTAALLKSDNLLRSDYAGNSAALREAMIGRIGGFTAVTVPGLHPDVAYAGHRTGVVLATRAPVVPQGASWGTSASYNGFALRTLRDYLPDDSNGPADRLLTDVFAGAKVVTDKGSLDVNGVFTPDADGGSDLVVRIVKLSLPASS